MPAKSLDVDYAEARKVAESGVQLKELAATLDVPYATLRQRAHREGWYTKAKVDKIVAGKIPPLPGMSPIVTKRPNSLEITAEMVKRRQDSHTALLERVTKKIWKRVEEAPPDVESIGDLEKLQKVTRLNLGMSTGEAQQAVQVLIGGQTDMCAAPMMDAELVVEEEEELDSSDEWDDAEE